MCDFPSLVIWNKNIYAAWSMDSHRQTLQTFELDQHPQRNYQYAEIRHTNAVVPSWYVITTTVANVKIYTALDPALMKLERLCTSRSARRDQIANIVTAKHSNRLFFRANHHYYTVARAILHRAATKAGYVFHYYPAQTPSN